MNYVEMFSKKENEVVRVYDISPSRINESYSVATIFIPSKLTVNYDVCWKTVKMTTLIPIEFKDAYLQQLPTSKTQKNKAKQRMQLVDATWKTSDGIMWEHKNIEDAIVHELELMEKEKNNTTE